MKHGIARLALLGSIGMPLAAAAASFGEIQVHSRIGEPLRAELPVLGGSELDNACYTLATPSGSDLPVISQARLRLIRDGNQRRLIITGSQPLQDPLVVLALRAGCGVDLQRDFALMPHAPVTAPMPARATVVPPATRDWVAGDGDTLQGIAEVLAGEDAVLQRRLLNGLRRVNPGLGADTPLPAGTNVALPDLNRRSSETPPAPKPAPVARKPATPEKKPAKPASKPTTPATKPQPAPKASAAPVAPARPAASGDRIVLGTAEEVTPTPKARTDNAGNTPAPRSLDEMQARIQQMESTLQALQQEIEQTNKVLELATEALAVQQKLRATQAEQAQLAARTAPTPPPEVKPEPSRPWLELVLSAALGGLIVAGLIHLLGRRRGLPGRPLRLVASPPEQRGPDR